MASLNKQQLVTLHRKVKEINYNGETNNWDIIFIDKIILRGESHYVEF